MEVQAARATVRRAPRRLRRAPRQLRPAQEGQARAPRPAGEAGGDAAGAAPARRRECRRRGGRALGRGRHEHEGGVRRRRRGAQAILGLRRWRLGRQVLPLRRGRRRRGALPPPLGAPASRARRLHVLGAGGLPPPPPPAAVVLPVPLELAVVVHGADHLRQLPMVGIRVPQRVIGRSSIRESKQTCSNDLSTMPVNNKLESHLVIRLDQNSEHGRRHRRSCPVEKMHTINRSWNRRRCVYIARNPGLSSTSRGSFFSICTIFNVLPLSFFICCC